MEVCYVCKKAIKGAALYIGQDTYRHPHRCAPGTERYMRRRKRANIYRAIMAGRD